MLPLAQRCGLEIVEMPRKVNKSQVSRSQWRIAGEPGDPIYALPDATAEG